MNHEMPMMMHPMNTNPNSPSNDFGCCGEITSGRNTDPRFTDAEVSHGKDGMKLLTAQFRALGASNLSDAAPFLWSTFRRESINQFPVLQQIIAYLSAS